MIDQGCELHAGGKRTGIHPDVDRNTSGARSCRGLEGLVVLLVVLAACSGTDRFDECVMNATRCGANATCREMKGMPTCTCDMGYTGDGVTCTDVDECAAHTDHCRANSSCGNTPGSFTCTCNPGYMDDGVTCTDIDECAAHTDHCGAHASCRNKLGSFSCMCDPGYAGDGVTCTDIDECSAHLDNCDVHASCLNTPGRFSCSCAPGYTGTGVSCTDIDECAARTDNCSPTATCHNTPGAFTCTCNSGYGGDGVVCNDIDECATHTDNCSENATCTNVPGGFVCGCNRGFTGNGITCTDIDECALHLDNCGANASCSNTPGLFTCACNPGYAGDGIICTDIDECALHLDNCSANATCSNTIGSFACACNPGYTGNGIICTDIDECALHLDNCGANASCSNTRGSFTCACNPGYAGDGITCTDIDECALHLDNCSANATCSNTIGSFTCACNPGFRGDGVHCYTLDEFCAIVNPQYPLCAGLPSLPPVVVSNLQTYVIVGRAESSSTVTVMVNGARLDSVSFQDGPDGFRDFMATAPLVPGDNQVSIAWQTLAFGMLTSSRVIVRDDAHPTNRLIYLDVQSAALDGTWVLDRDQADAPIGLIDGHIAAVAPDHAALYLTDLRVLDVATNHAQRTLPTSLGGLALTSTVISRDGRFLYASNLVVDIASNVVIRTLPVSIAMQSTFGRGGPAISPDGRYIYFGNPVQRLDLATDIVTSTGISSPFLTDVAVSPDDSFVAAAMFGNASGQLVIVDTATLQTQAVIGMGDFTGFVEIVDNVAFCGAAGNPVLGRGGFVAVDLTTFASSRVTFQRADALAAISPGEAVVSSGPAAGIEIYANGPAGLVRTEAIFLGLNRSSFRTDIRAIFLADRASQPPPRPAARTGHAADGRRLP